MSVTQISEFTRDEQIAAIVGGVVGVVPTAAILQVAAPDESLLVFAWLIGGSTTATGLAVWIGSGLLFSLGFALSMARTINKFTNTIIMISRKSRVTQALLVPILHQSALGLTAGSMGFIYGQVLGFGFFAWLMPILLAMNGHITSFPLADFAVIGAYMLYGILLGTTYGVLLEAEWYEPARTADEQNAAVGGALAGGVAGVGVLYLLAGPAALTDLGGVVDGTAPVHGAFVFVAAAVAFGLAFAWILARTINDFTNTVIMFSRRSELTQKLLVPLISRAALTVTAGSMGLVYGTTLGITAFVAGAVGVIPQLGPVWVVAFAVYGHVLGNGYGLLMETVDASTFVPSAEQRAGALAALVAGLLSTVLVVAVVDYPVFRWLAEAVGASGITTGVGVWLLVCVLLGLVFVGYVSRTINDFTNTVIMFSRRSELTQKLLVPLISRAALTVTAGSMGLVYGLGLGVVVYGLVLAGVAPPVSPIVVVVFAVYGNVLGNGYGAILERPTLGLPTPTPAGGAAEPAAPDPEPATAGAEAYEQLEGFAAWRTRRPFAGGLMLILAGLIIGALPLRLQSIFPGMSWSAMGIFFAAMVIACGLFVLVKPELSTILGILGVSFSILSLIGAFGGLVIGMLVGIVGGNLCISWQNPSPDEPVEEVEEVEDADEDRFNWIGERDQQW